MTRSDPIDFDLFILAVLNWVPEYALICPSSITLSIHQQNTISSKCRGKYSPATPFFLVITFLTWINWCDGIANELLTTGRRIVRFLQLHHSFEQPKQPILLAPVQSRLLQRTYSLLVHGPRSIEFFLLLGCWVQCGEANTGNKIDHKGGILAF